MADSIVAQEEHRKQLGAMDWMERPRNNRMMKQKVNAISPRDTGFVKVPWNLSRACTETECAIPRCCCFPAVRTFRVRYVMQAAHHALEELCGAVHAELDDARSAMSNHRAYRQALLRRIEAAEQAITDVQNESLNEMSTESLPSG